MRPNERFKSQTSEPDAPRPQPKATAPPAPEPVVTELRPVEPEPPRPSDEDPHVARGEAEVSKEMRELLSKPFSQQKKALKAIRAKWHPDKNSEQVELATKVFQFIQAHDEWLQFHGLA